MTPKTIITIRISSNWVASLQKKKIWIWIPWTYVNVYRKDAIS